MNIKSTQWIVVLILLSMANIAWSQSLLPLDIAIKHIETNHKSWSLTASDIEGMVVSDQYTNKQSGTTYLYFNQQHQGIALQNAIINVSVLDNGRVNFVGNRFTSNLATKINESVATLTSEEALKIVMNDLGIKDGIPRSTTIETGKKYTYDGAEIANHKIYSNLLYKKIDGEIKLIWDIVLAPKGQLETWNYAIKATTGDLLKKQDITLKCKFEHQPFHNHDAHCNAEGHLLELPKAKEKLTNSKTAMIGGYRVFPYSVMSPNDGSRELVIDPNHLSASPYGWHDTNGDANPEYNYTRGNNTHAFVDRNNDFESDIAEPNGGMTLLFDFPFDPDAEPLGNADAAVTNLFYVTNMAHDFAYVYGFDEAAGNFQMNNYGNGGTGGDIIIARAQAAADVSGLPDNVNNSTFSAFPDGQNGYMNMYVWDENYAVTGLLNITEPSAVTGQYNTIAAEYGPLITNTPISGEIIEVNDNVYEPSATDACEDFSMVLDLTGKIALIDRGGCLFEQKTANAEAAGAIAVIICNFEDQPMGMADSDDVEDPNIPTISIGAIDCATIRQFAGSGLQATIVQPSDDNGPDFLDGSFDNGIIIHEYAHGISHRLTGGPGTTGCLPFFDTDGDGTADDGEQMGEGWSDFFALVMTVKSGDAGEMKRGMGTYVQRQDINATGIRTYPYSTDMSINPHTYADINAARVPHGVGSVWCAILWDLYWKMVEVHGFVEDQFNGDGGNNRAIRLVMEGLKNQVCEPGFVDGRNAILAADTDLYGGENQCLIWEVFARRGVGVDAEQGSSLTRYDQVENFDVLPTCIAELKITKTTTSLIQAGDNVNISIKVTNHKNQDLTGVVVTDEIPEGATYLNGSCSLGNSAVTVNGNMVSFDLGEMAYLDVLDFNYKLSTSADDYSVRNFYEDAESVDFDFWLAITITTAPMNQNSWNVSTDGPFTGQYSWYIENIDEESHQILQAGKPSDQIFLAGDNPVLRFFHNYNTEPGSDGGVVEISTDGGIFWNQLGDDMFRGGYPGLISYFTFVIPNFEAFFGDSNGWKATYVDLSDYAGEEVILRWNFRTDDNTAPEDGFWKLDNIEIMDMVNYNGEACVTSDQGDLACAVAANRGTIVESQADPTSTYGPTKANLTMNVFPNPTDSQINLSITSQDNQNVVLSIISLDGREVIAKNIETSTLTQTFTMDVSALPAGFYFVKASTNQGVVVEKIIIE